MKIRRIKINEIDHRPLLNGLEMLFSDDNNDTVDPNCFIGVNGSGKSQFLETIAEIFYYLDKLFRKVNRTIIGQSPCLFEIDYAIFVNGSLFEVRIKQDIKRGKSPEFLIFDENFDEFIPLSFDDLEDYLPSKIIGYTSGDNETLSIPFMDYYDEYAEHTAKRALRPDDIDENESKDYEPRFYLMDYNTNKGVVISNLILGNDDSVKKILDLISVESVRNFQLVIQTKHGAAKGKDGILFTPELKDWVQKLKMIASAYEYDAVSNRYILDFYLSPATKEAFKHYFNDSLELYTALYKIELLNNLIIDKRYREEIKKLRRNRRLLIKNPTVPDQDKVLNYSEIKIKLKNNEVVDYIYLSDGEHQFLNIFGTILMLDQDNALFLLDEPETHFNPKWRREFVKLWNDITVGRLQDNFLTSHSPFVVSDCKRDKVYIFSKNDDYSLDVYQPSKETYGSSFDFILKSAFNLDSTLSEKSLEEISELLKSNDVDEIENRLSDFGESTEKFYLLKRIEEIKLQK